MEGEGGWVPQTDPDDLDHLLEEFTRRPQNMNKKTGELHISSFSVEQSDTLQQKP